VLLSFWDIDENCVWHVIDLPCWCAISLGSEDNLRAALSKMGVNSRATDDVIEKARNRHYQVRESASFSVSLLFYCTSPISSIWLFLIWIVMYVQLACTLTFEAIHGSSCDAGVNHPNQYFIDSQKILQSKVNHQFLAPFYFWGY